MNDTNILSQLFTSLPLFLQKKIKIYYLSYGTEDARLIKNIIQKSKKMRDNPTLTLYDLFIYNHGYVKCRIEDDMKIPLAYQELELIRIMSDITITNMASELKQYIIQHLLHNIKRIFVSKYKLLL